LGIQEEREVMNYKKHDLLEAMWQKMYYGNLINCKVVGVKTEVDEYSSGVWPVILFEDQFGTIFEATVSRDPEGNGPGFMFGLPEVSNEANMERINRMTNEEIESLYKEVVHIYE
jgi:hypothetical protein